MNLIEEQKNLAAQMSKEDWSFLCRNLDFIKAIMEDIKEAKRIAEKSLNKKIN